MSHLPRLPCLVASALLLGACRSTNPIGFWDLVRLEVSGGSHPDQEQLDVGTMEWDERDNLYLVFRYVPGVPGQPLQLVGQTHPEEGSLAEDWLTPTAPPILASGSAPENKSFSAFVGELSTGATEMTSYQGDAMTFVAPDARIGNELVELLFELER